jgi:tetratricopeptide (TPR) repeat protein
MRSLRLEEEQVDEETEEDEKLHEEDPVGPSPEDQDMINKYRQKGTELYQNGEYAEAIVEWQKILELEPDHPEIMDSIQEAMAKLSE